jgi:RHS repeat-associated protein
MSRRSATRDFDPTIPTAGAFNSDIGVAQFYHYDGQKLTEMDDQPGTIIIHNYSYDSSWRLVTDAIAAGEKKTYTYAGTGSLLSSYTIQPPSGTSTSPQSVSYAYGGNGQVTGETWSWTPNAPFTFDYTPTGQYSRMTFPNGQQRLFTYDNQDRLTNITNKSPGGGTVASFDYAYDYDWQAGGYSMRGQRTSVFVTAPGAANLVAGLTKYSYDASYQLVRADYPNNTYDAWTYDAIGNRLSRRVPGGGYTLPYTYYTNAASGNTQRLRNDSSYEFTYDASGNVTAATAPGISNAYVWDYSNRLTSYGGKTYTYDAFGRASVAASGSTTRYIGLNSNTVSERNTSSGVATDYLFGPGIDEPLAKRTANGSITYYGADGLGSIVVATDPTGAVLSSTGYSPWGETVTAPSELFGYTGRETGGPSWYYRSRHYDASHGRFLSADAPTGLPPEAEDFYPELRSSSGHPYVYVLNDPIRYTDPSGHQAETAAIAVPVSFVGPTAAAAATAAAIACALSPNCRHEAKCLAKYVADLADCTKRGLCPAPDERQTERVNSCLNRSLSNYRACRRGWPRPFPSPWPNFRDIE